MSQLSAHRSLRDPRFDLLQLIPSAGRVPSRAGLLDAIMATSTSETPRPRIIRAASNIVITEPAILPFALLVRPFLTEIVLPQIS